METKCASLKITALRDR